MTAGNVRVKGLALTFKFGVATDGHEVELVLRPLVHRHGPDKATVGTGPTLPSDEEDGPETTRIDGAAKIGSRMRTLGAPRESGALRSI